MPETPQCNTLQIFQILLKPPWRTLAGCLLIILIAALGYQLWTPGKHLTDGRHDRKRNGIWLQHGWLGDDAWFQRNRKDRRLFRDAATIARLHRQLVDHHITDLYPHVAPCAASGAIAAVDPEQTQLFLDAMKTLRVMPWVGGVLNVHAFPESTEWRQNFIHSIRQLFADFPRLAGIHLNIEPMPSGNKAFLILLRELKPQLPPDKILSVAAYPPPTIHQPVPEVHWEREYYQQVARHADQMVIMMYDTGIKYQKFYQHLMGQWSREVLTWTEVPTGTKHKNTEILLGVPAYDDEGARYHYPRVENLQNAIMGIHAGLASYPKLPLHYQGIAIYCEWEMEEDEWVSLRNNFLRK